MISLPNPDGYALWDNPMPKAKVNKARRALKRYARKYDFDSTRSYPLVSQENRTLHQSLGICNVQSAAEGTPLQPKDALVVGTIRMGYGHYRMALAIASAARSMGLTPYWFDLLGFESPGARFIRDLDYWYSLGSRISSRVALFDALVWEPLCTKAYMSLHRNIPIFEACRLMADVYKELPPGLPFVGTHPWTAHAAVHAGRKSIVNTIPDNWPMAFLLSPGAINSVQSPQAYHQYRRLSGMGRKGASLKPLPGSDILLAGHYVDHELVANLEEDCHQRLKRLEAKEPRRLLFSMGGAGAQKKMYIEVLKHLIPQAKEGRLTLLFNLGDHQDRWQSLLKDVPALEEVATVHRQWEDTTAFARHASTDPISGIHVFLHDDIFAAVYTTNLLMRCTDFLVTKPSELSYYPVPKIFTRRVGGHEAWGAIRSAELGDGTPELRTVDALLHCLETVSRDGDWLKLYCDRTLVAKKAGTYDGAYRVVEQALASL